MMRAKKHWLLLRGLSLPLIPLAVYFLSEMPYINTRSRMEFLAWAGQPLTALALLAFIICAFGHAYLGMEEILLDYIPAKKGQKLALLANQVIFAGIGGATVIAVLVITFGKF